MTTRKSKTVGIHLNDNEYAEIKARADTVAARSLGAYIKAIVFDAPVPEQKTVRHTKVADPALIRQLAWIGNNVNQIARAVNQSESINQTDAASLFAVLAIIAEELEALNEDAL
ncbi:MAG: plasmid mobilization relaxosome protein MobC [Mariprofundus sp.]|nr:plasmid mobilization relaxosome protein MobC [Mariprofundus sp.]